MSGRSVTITIGTTGSIRTTPSTGSNGVKLAGEESKDKMYEPKHSKKMVRVLTVIAYMFTVSLAAIMLSVYYVFLWSPRYMHKMKLIHHAKMAQQAMEASTPASPPQPPLSPIQAVSLEDVRACCCPHLGMQSGGDMSFSSRLSHATNVQISTDFPPDMPTLTSQEEDVDDDDERTNNADLVDADAGT